MTSFSYGSGAERDITDNLKKVTSLAISWLFYARKCFEADSFFPLPITNSLQLPILNQQDFKVHHVIKYLQNCYRKMDFNRLCGLKLLLRERTDTNEEVWQQYRFDYRARMLYMAQGNQYLTVPLSGGCQLSVLKNLLGSLTNIGSRQCVEFHMIQEKIIPPITTARLLGGKRALDDDDDSGDELSWIKRRNNGAE